MAKIRIHELAKELDMQGKDILSFVQEKGVEARSVSSSLEDDMADTVRKRFSKGGGKQEPEKPVKAAVEGKKEETPVRREAEKKDTEKRETEKVTQEKQEKRETPAEERPAKSSAHPEAQGAKEFQDAGKASGGGRKRQKTSAGRRSEQIPGRRPGKTSGRRPEQISGRRSGKTSGRRPGQASGRRPGRKRFSGQRLQRPQNTAGGSRSHAD